MAFKIMFYSKIQTPLATASPARGSSAEFEQFLQMAQQCERGIIELRKLPMGGRRHEGDSVKYGKIMRELQLRGGGCGRPLTFNDICSYESRCGAANFFLFTEGATKHLHSSALKPAIVAQWQTLCSAVPKVMSSIPATLGAFQMEIKSKKRPCVEF